MMARNDAAFTHPKIATAKHCPIMGLSCIRGQCELWISEDIWFEGKVVRTEEVCSFRRIAILLNRI